MARIISILSSALLMVAAVAAFLASPYAGSAYLQVTTGLGSELPLITKYFSLAFLGNHKSPFSIFPERAVWAWGSWSVLLCWPIVLVALAIRAPFDKFMALWCIGVIAYLSMIAALTVVVGAGLVLPFSGLLQR